MKIAYFFCVSSDISNNLKKDIHNSIKTNPFLSDCSLVLHSDHKNSLFTAKEINQIHNGKSRLSNLLNEVILNPKETDHINRLSNWISGYSNENFSNESFLDSKKRFFELLDLLKTTNDDRIICLTHEWFIKIIQLYLRGKDLDNINIQDLIPLQPIKNMSYLTLEI